MEIINKADELGLMLEQSIQYKEYKDAKDNFLNNQELQTGYKEYTNLYINYVKTKDASLEEQINNRYNELLNSSDFAIYLQTKKDFEDLVSAINDSITKYVEIDANSCSKKKCGGCRKD